jgi:hypothetical protein
MEFRDILRQLWRLRLLVALGVLLSAVATLFLNFDVSFSPLKVKRPSSVYGAAQTSVFVDYDRPSLVTDPRDYGPLISRAEVLGRVVDSRLIKGQAAQALGVPMADVAVEGPYPNEANHQTTQPGAQQRANQILGENSNYRIFVDTDADAPIITLYTQAPTGADAVRLADLVADGLSQYVIDLKRKDRVAEGSAFRDSLRVTTANKGKELSAAEQRQRKRAFFQGSSTIRRLGDAVGGSARDQTGRLMILLTFAGGILAWCVLLILVSGARRAIRSPQVSVR